MNACKLVIDYFGSDGYVHCHADCGPCYTVQFAYYPNGPWYFDRNGVAGQDIPIEPNPTPGGSNKYYRAIPRDCDPIEPDPTVPPEGEEPPNSGE